MSEGARPYIQRLWPGHLVKPCFDDGNDSLPETPYPEGTDLISVKMNLSRMEKASFIKNHGKRKWFICRRRRRINGERVGGPYYELKSYFSYDLAMKTNVLPVPFYLYDVCEIIYRYSKEPLHTAYCHSQRVADSHFLGDIFNSVAGNEWQNGIFHTRNFGGHLWAEYFLDSAIPAVERLREHIYRTGALVPNVVSIDTEINKVCAAKYRRDPTIKAIDFGRVYGQLLVFLQRIKNSYVYYMELRPDEVDDMGPFSPYDSSDSSLDGMATEEEDEYVQNAAAAANAEAEFEEEEEVVAYNSVPFHDNELKVVDGQEQDEEVQVDDDHNQVRMQYNPWNFPIPPAPAGNEQGILIPMSPSHKRKKRKRSNNKK